ncbi:hypothetical protein NT6N_15380 [Oceaniferula spumae]|uniref:EF-hand domain-containing protein n=1 Tax=Oceaniferula spumae TaxID=2979115 RepID=A0AAT9FKM6_9BACT
MKIHQLFSIGLCSLLLCSVASAKGGKAKKSFDEIDADKDGKVSLAEFTAGAKDEEKAKAVFTKKDKDSDGFLSKKELGGKGEAKGKDKKKGKKGPKKPKKNK